MNIKSYKPWFLTIVIMGFAISSGFSQSIKFSDLDFEKSPYTGYTRKHWLEITEQIIAGTLNNFNQATGLSNFISAPDANGYETYRWKAPEESHKRALERMMTAVFIYTKATGKDVVPGYEGSISKPFIKAIIQGTDPESPHYWGEPLPNDQVGSMFALAVYLEPARYWDPLTVLQKQNLLSYFKKLAYIATHNNNHYFFHMIPVSILDRENIASNRDHLTKMYQRLMGWYRGDGWFLDGNNRGFDYYNLWGFQLFNNILYKYDVEWRKLFGEKIKETTQQFIKNLVYLYGRDGAPIPWGRSLSYRFAGNSAIAWAVINNISPIAPGQARRITSGALKYFWDRECLGKDKLLHIGYWGANASVAEAYLDYGDPYWASQGLACLLIPENDPFWTATELPDPADGKGGAIALKGAQMVVKVNGNDGEARLYPVGQPLGKPRSIWQAGAKYDQHAYSSYLGFCLTGEGGQEIGAGRTGYSYDGKRWMFRESSFPISITSTHVFSRYLLNTPKQKDSIVLPDNRDELFTHTLIGTDGEVHIFWHNNPDPIFLHLGGYGISISGNNTLSEETKGNTFIINAGDFYSVIESIMAPQGKIKAETLVPRPGWSHTHLYGGKGCFPYWQSQDPVPPNTPVVFFVNGTRGRKSSHDKIEVVKTAKELKVKFEGKLYHVEVPF